MNVTKKWPPQAKAEVGELAGKEGWQSGGTSNIVSLPAGDGTLNVAPGAGLC